MSRLYRDAVFSNTGPSKRGFIGAHMGQIEPFHHRRTIHSAARPLFFSRHELCRLLQLYSRRVATGDWRDYALDYDSSIAVFSVFKHTLDAPLYAISKTRFQSGYLYAFYQGNLKLFQSRNLDEILRAFDKRLQLIT